MTDALETKKLIELYALAKGLVADDIRSTLVWTVNGNPCLLVEGTFTNVEIRSSGRENIYEVWCNQPMELIKDELSLERLWRAIVVMRDKYALAVKSLENQEVAGHA